MRKRATAPTHAAKREGYISLGTGSGDSDDRIDLGVQVPHLCQGFIERNAPQPANDLYLPGTASKISR